GQVIHWDGTTSLIVADWIRTSLRQRAPINCVFVEGDKMYFYHDDFKNKFLRLEFKNKKERDYAITWFSQPRTLPTGQTLTLNYLEDKFDNILRYLSEQKLDYSEWIKVPLTKVDPQNKCSTCSLEVTTYWTEVQPDPQDKAPKLTKLAIDIETFSDRAGALSEASFT